MIESLKLENFESHENTILNFSPGLNVFVGESDKGKSGVFRAYKLLTQNKPGGESMRPLYWEGTTKVIGKFVNPALTVTRTRGKSENTYTLNEDEPVNAGTSVPENIAKLLDLDDVNLQTQIERAFLMFESAGERGRILNRIAGLDEIESTLDNAKQDVSRLDKLWKAEKATIEAKQKELDDFVDIEDMEARVAVIDSNQNLLFAAEARSTKLTKLSESLKTLENAIVSKEGLLACQGMLEAVKLNVQAVSALQTRINKLRLLGSKYSTVQAKLDKENFEGVDGKFDKIRVDLDCLGGVEKRVKRLKKLSGDLGIIEQDIKEVEAELITLQSQIPNVCTECGAELNK